MIPYRCILRSIREVVEKSKISEGDKKKLEKATESVIGKLLPVYGRETCFENLLKASVYIGSREIEKPLNPLQVNQMCDSESAAWIDSLDVYYLEFKK